MFDMCEDQTGGQTEGPVVRNETGEAARSLKSRDEDFEFYSKCMIAINEQMSKQTNTGVNGQPGRRKACMVPNR